VSLPLYLKFLETAKTRFLQQRDPKISNLQNLISPSILDQITTYKAQNSSFFILFHLHQSKLLENPSNGRTIEEAKGRFDFIRSHRNSKLRSIQSADNQNSSLHIISYFFDDEVFDCFQAFQNFGLIQFISMKLPFCPELVKASYSILEIQEDSLIYEVYGIKMVIDQSLLFELTQLSCDGVPFEGTLDDEWKFDFSVSDARRMVCTNQADMTGRLLAGSLAFECRIMHYLIICILLPRSSNLTHVSEEDLIIMSVFLTGRQIEWAHLMRYRMHKAL